MNEPSLASRKLSAIKGLSWRCVATLTTFLITWALTGETGTASKVAGIEFVLKFGIYYGHERFWVWLPTTLANRKANKQSNRSAKRSAA